MERGCNPATSRCSSLLPGASRSPKNAKAKKMKLQKAKGRSEGGRGAHRRWLQPKENALEFI